MSKKVYIAIFLLAMLIVTIAAIIYATQTPPSVKPAVSGLNVGDTFTYIILSRALTAPDTVTPDYLYQYNETAWYKITIVAVNGSEVSFDGTWRFTNGTEIKNEQIIDSANGVTIDPSGFWAVYASHAQAVGNGNGQVVIGTENIQYKDSTRETYFWSLEVQESNSNDPTGNTIRDVFINGYFDKQTGMLESLSNVQEYYNPQMSLTITWQLIDSSVWAV